MHHHPPLCSYCPYALYTFLPQARICQILNVPWEFQQCTRLHRESRCDKWTNTLVLPHSDPEGSWGLNRMLARTPGNKQGGYKEKMPVAFNLMRIFPLGPSCSLHCNYKVDTQHPRPPLRWDIIALLLLRLLPLCAVWRSWDFCLESASSWKPPHTGVAWRTPTKRVSLCSLLIEELFRLWLLILSIQKLPTGTAHSSCLAKCVFKH